MKKYELVDEPHIVHGDDKVYHQIRALKDFICQGVEIHKGDLGGFVEFESNLSQDDNSWIAVATVYGDNVVPKDALVCADGYASEHGIDRARLKPYNCGWAYIVQ